jgi:hypothetical protein
MPRHFPSIFVHSHTKQVAKTWIHNQSTRLLNGTENKFLVDIFGSQLHHINRLLAPVPCRGGQSEIRYTEEMCMDQDPVAATVHLCLHWGGRGLLSGEYSTLYCIE